jgi:hypothetical protein
MTPRQQVVQISARSISFTAVCVECCDLDAAEGYSGSTFAGRLELDVQHAAFLCRRGHPIDVVRVEAEQLAADSAA